MEKLKMRTPDLTDKNIERIASLFPNVITEVEEINHETHERHEKKYKKVVDFDLLRQMLSDNMVEGSDERYRLDWPGKKASLLKANTPITKTLRPCREESVNFDTTENLYIEGDNFEVLKILQERYLGKVKMIYIDPPYNTGNDFIYKDNFIQDKDEYDEEIGAIDEDGNKMFKENTKTNPRWHSDWLSMMYERLVVARDLLKDDGVIFISIDDNEIHNLRKICDELFGEENFVAQITVIVKTEGRRYGFFAKTHEQILIYCKNLDELQLNEIEIMGKAFQFKDEVGGFNLQELRNQNARAFNSTNRPNLRYPFYVDLKNADENGFCKVLLNNSSGLTEVYPITVNGSESVWRWGKNEKAKQLLHELVARRGTDGIIRIYQKMRKLSEMPKTVFTDKRYISIKGTRELQELLGLGVFDFPKPVELIKEILKIGTSEDDIILDYFSGSATTAHAVMQLNAEDGGNRKFIMVQLPEKTDENSEAYKAGYKTIADIGKERIRRAGKKILEELTTKHTKNTKEENNKDLFSEADKENFRAFRVFRGLDIGFRVYKTDDTNMKDVFYHPAELEQKQLSFLESNIKEDRTPEDLLTQVILDLGLELSLPIETKKIGKNTGFIVQTNALVACFDNDIDFKIVDTIAGLKPFKVVFKDASFKDDKDRINVEERFKRLSPDTKVMVI